jgi:ubiquinone/menaquinone biosynthesis C-methylase UbiE
MSKTPNFKNIDHLGQYIRFSYLNKALDEHLTKNAKRVLSCGLGKPEVATVELDYLASKYPDKTFVGMDLNSASVNSARATNKHPNARYHIEDITKMRYGNEVYDFFFALDVLEHISDDNTAIREINRVTKKGGNIFIHVPYDRGIKCPEHARTGYTVETLTNLLENNGFKTNKVVNTFIEGKEVEVYRIWSSLKRGHELNKDVISCGNKLVELANDSERYDNNEILKLISYIKRDFSLTPEIFDSMKCVIDDIVSKENHAGYESKGTGVAIIGTKK